MSGSLDPLTEKEIQAPGWHLLFSGLSRDGSGKGGWGGGEHLVYVSTNARDPPLCVGGWGME